MSFNDKMAVGRHSLCSSHVISRRIRIYGKKFITDDRCVFHKHFQARLLGESSFDLVFEELLNVGLSLASRDVDSPVEFLVKLALLEGLEPLGVSSHVDFEEEETNDKDVLESNHSSESVLGVLLLQFEPG
jgi:hypothetical protein